MGPRAAARALLFFAVTALVASTPGVLPAGAQQRTAQPVPGMSYLDDIWCGPDGVCLGVGTAPGPVGAVVVLRANGQTGPVRTVPGMQRVSAIDCPVIGSCVAVGTGASGGMVVEVSRDGTPGPARSVPRASAMHYVACPTATTCLATGALHVFPPHSAHGVTTAVFVVITNGQPAPAQDFPRGTRWTLHAHGIDCPTTTTCLVVATGAIVVLRDAGGPWLTTLRTIPVDSGAGHPRQDISCASSTTCYATASGFGETPEGYYGIPGMVPVTADGVTGPVQVLSERRGISNGISCVFGRSCTVVGQEHTTGRGLSIDVFRGSPGPAVVWPDVNLFRAVSCIAPATCGIVGYMPPHGAVFAWHGPVPV